MPKELEDDDLMADSDESDEVPSDLDDLSDEDAEQEDASDISADGEEDDDKSSDAENDEDAEDGDAFSLAEESDAEDLLPLDAEVPMGLIEYDGSESESEAEAEAEEWGGISPESPKKGGKRKRDEEKKAQRKKLRSLPTFASYEDYAKLIEDGPEDNI